MHFYSTARPRVRGRARGRARGRGGGARGAVLLARGTMLAPEDLPVEIPTLQARRGMTTPNLSLPYNDAMRRLYQDASQSYIEQVLARFEGNVTQAARHAKIPRESLHRMMRKFGINASDLRRTASQKVQ